MLYSVFKINFRRWVYMLAGEMRRKIQDKRLIQPLLERYIQQIFHDVKIGQVLDYKNELINSSITTTKSL